VRAPQVRDLFPELDFTIQWIAANEAQIPRSELWAMSGTRSYYRVVLKWTLQYAFRPHPSDLKAVCSRRSQDYLGESSDDRRGYIF
jgi:hypothetical protein